MNRTSILAGVATAGLLAGAAWWYSERQAAPPMAPVPDSPTAAAPEPAPPQPAGPRFPLAADPSLPSLTAKEIPAALRELLGRKTVAEFFAIDDFPRRFVASLDNLGRSQAPSALWPVTVTPGRFTVETRDGVTVIAGRNETRYAPLVRVAERLDVGRTVKVYQRMYPVLEATYRELGFPKGSLNDRVVDVIDTLLATPDIDRPPEVQLVDVKGSVPSERPWVRYEFTDPALQSLTAGQKILLRVGPHHEHSLKAKLGELRAALTATPHTAN